MKTALAISLCAALLAMRGAWHTGPVDFDAARHCMNGALLHDMVRDSSLARPISYAKEYFARYPAISIPYHPPGFPLLEAMLFALLGVSYPTARFAVALSVAASVLFLYLLALRLTGSGRVALAATALFHGLGAVRAVAGEVMLEFPALAAMFASLILLERALARGVPYPGIVAAAVVASAAVWTKQNVLFLAPMPLLAALAVHGRKAARSRRLWLASAILAASSVALIALMQTSGSGSNPAWPKRQIWQTVGHNFFEYSRWLGHQFSWPLLLLAAAAIAWFVWTRFRQRHHPAVIVLLLWLCGSAALPLVIPPLDYRYLIYFLPALLLVTLLFVARLLARLGVSLQRQKAAATLGIAALWIATTAQPARLTGLPDAARYLAARQPSRILLCSPRNGSFTFTYRSVAQAGQTRILRAESLSREFFKKESLAAFLHDFAIDYVVIHESPSAAACESDGNALPIQLRLERVFEVAGTVAEKGVVRIYRNLSVSPRPFSTFHHAGRLGTRVVTLD